jgi:hypothetical protein
VCSGSTLRNVGAGWQGVEQHPHVRSTRHRTESDRAEET